MVQAGESGDFRQILEREPTTFDSGLALLADLSQKSALHREQSLRERLSRPPETDSLFEAIMHHLCKMAYLTDRRLADPSPVDPPDWPPLPLQRPAPNHLRTLPHFLSLDLAANRGTDALLEAYKQEVVHLVSRTTADSGPPHWPMDRIEHPTARPPKVIGSKPSSRTPLRQPEAMILGFDPKEINLSPPTLPFGEVLSWLRPDQWLLVSPFPVPIQAQDLADWHY
jgi:hypothetical protein